MKPSHGNSIQDFKRYLDWQLESYDMQFYRMQFYRYHKTEGFWDDVAYQTLQEALNRGFMLGDEFPDALIDIDAAIDIVEDKYDQE